MTPELVVSHSSEYSMLLFHDPHDQLIISLNAYLPLHTHSVILSELVSIFLSKKWSINFQSSRCILSTSKFLIGFIRFPTFFFLKRRWSWSWATAMGNRITAHPKRRAVAVKAAAFNPLIALRGGAAAV